MYSSMLDTMHAACCIALQYTGCIKMNGAVWKLIVFTRMVERLINTSRNETVMLINGPT